MFNTKTSAINELKLLVVTSALLAVCQGAPASYNLEPKWREDDNNVPLAAVLPPVTACDPATGKCWDWMPAVEPRPGDAYAIAPDEQDLELSRAQLIYARDVDQVTDQWHDVPRYAEGKIPMQPGNGNQATGRLAKKDVFMSRGWGAGGMPFSVLYMNPRNHSASAGSSDKAEGNGKGMTSVRKNNLQEAAVGNRLSTRNGGTGTNVQNRRKNPSMSIPHLFVSYGWGPAGK